MAVTLRFQSSGRIPGRADLIRMRGRSMTMGRSPQNDVVLPDPDQLISNFHCVLEDHGGRIMVLDLSSNGTYLNYGKVPLGRNPTPLNDGDVLTVGLYELVVGISDVDVPDPLDLPPLGRADEPLPPLGDQPRGAPTLPALQGDPLGDDLDFVDALLGDAPPAGPSRVQRPDLADDGLLPPLAGGLLDAVPGGPARGHTGASRADHSDPMTDSFRPQTSRDLIPDDWGLDDLMPGSAPPRPLPPVRDTPVAVPPMPMGRDPFAEPPPPPRPAEPRVAHSPDHGHPDHSHHGHAHHHPPAVAGDAAARAFLTALGAGDVPVGDADLVATMTRLGQAMNVMVQGLREVLMTRSAIKSEFRIQQTMISAGGNNPLKFSVSPEQAVEALVRPRARGYLEAPDAAAQALDDIKAHEMAVMSGLEAALKGILHKLSPQALEGRIEVSGGLGSLLKGRKARYWEVYEKMYAEIAGQAADDFHDLFAREFARAYQQQLDALKQSGTGSKGQNNVVG